MTSTARQNPLLRFAKRLAIKALIAVAIVIPARAYVLTPYRVSGDSVAPELKSGTLAFVYRLTSDFHAGDIVAYHHGENTYLGRCESITPDALQLSRKDETAIVPRTAIIGRVILSTR